MGIEEINWFDKALLAVAEFGNDDQATRYDVYPIKVGMAVSLGLNFIMGLLWFTKFGMPTLPKPPIPHWVVVSIIFVLCYIPIHLSSHSSEKIVSYEFSSKERWVYRILGWLLIGSWIPYIFM